MGVLNVDGRTILKWIVNKYVTQIWLNSTESPFGPEEILFVCGNEHSVSMKGGKFPG